MATLEQLAEGIRRAHAAGNAEHVKVLGAEYRRLQAAGQGSGQPASVDMNVQRRFNSRASEAPGPVDFVSQGMSGLNEGIAMGLGAPVDIASTLINLGTSGVNALTGSTIPQIEKPFGGSDRIREGMLAPTIRAESSDPALQATRRVMQEVGAWALPGGGLAARTAKPVKTVAKELPAVLGSGGGAAVAQQIAPDNPLAEFAGQVVGGFSPKAIGSSVRRTAEAKKAPTLDELREQKRSAYRAVDNSGILYRPEAYDDLLVNIATEARAHSISPDRHKAAYSMIRDLAGKRGKAISLTELDQMRQIIRRDLITPSYTDPRMQADAFFGEMMLDQIDDFIGAAGPRQVFAGDPVSGAANIAKARELNTRFRKTELIEDVLTKATRKADSTGSGGNINNNIRQGIRAILDSKKKSAAFTKTELAAMESLVRQGKMENLLRLLGKLSPSGNGLMAALGITGTAVNPLLAAVPATGYIAKRLADQGTVSAAQKLRAQVARGAPAKLPLLTDEQRRLAGALVYAQGAGQMQNQPLEITVRGGSAR